MPHNTPEKRAASKRAFLQRRKYKWFSENGPCKLCGSSVDLQVDHIDPSKKSFSIHWGIREDVLQIELLKCRVLCKECHIKLSAEQKRKPVDELKGIYPVSAAIRYGIPDKDFKHGTVNGARYHRCKCDACRGAYNSYAKELRQRPDTARKIAKYNRDKRPTPENGYFLTDPIPQLPAGFTHGTNYGFIIKKCRCAACVAVFRERWARWRARQPKKEKTPIVIRHGTSTAYCHHACRCEICRAFMRELRAKQWQKEKAKRPPVEPKPKPPIVHGKYGTYCRHACRCAECCASAQEYRDKKRAAVITHGSPV